MNSEYCTDIDEASWRVRKIFPALENAEFEIPEQGQQNFVLLHNNTAIRMARHEWAAKAMARESEILRLIAPDCPAAIPALIGRIPEHHVMRTTRVPGQPLSPQILEQLGETQQRTLAIQLAEFIAHMHEGVPLSEEQKLSFRADPTYFHTQVRNLIETKMTANITPGYRKKLEDAKDYMDHYNDIADDIVLTHGDLMSGNILYDENSGKIAIIDFTGASVGYRHLEFKKLLTYPPHFLNAVITHYEEMTGYKVDLDLVRKAYSLNEAFNTRNDPLQKPPSNQKPSSFKSL